MRIAWPDWRPARPDGVLPARGYEPLGRGLPHLDWRFAAGRATSSGPRTFRSTPHKGRPSARGSAMKPACIRRFCSRKIGWRSIGDTLCCEFLDGRWTGTHALLYSVRMATSGSTFDARRAGMSAAAMAADAMSSAASTHVLTSSGLMP